MRTVFSFICVWLALLVYNGAVSLERQITPLQPRSDRQTGGRTTPEDHRPLRPSALRGIVFSLGPLPAPPSCSPRPLTSFILGPLILFMISFAFHLIQYFYFFCCYLWTFGTQSYVPHFLFFLIALGKLKLRYNKFICARLCLSTH